LESINLTTKQPEAAAYERSDVCAVSAASVIVENVVAFEVARALIEKFGNDSLLRDAGTLGSVPRNGKEALDHNHWADHAQNTEVRHARKHSPDALPVAFCCCLLPTIVVAVCGSA
jgi:hypothetical protein